MDFNHIINSSEGRYNLHSHTQFCDGRAPMAEFAAAAVAAGFRHYGFSPHSPIPFDSPCNMSFDDVDRYLAEVDRLKALYSGQIDLYAAMEIDYLGEEWGPSNEYFRSLPLDYTIGSVHFLPSDEGYIDIDGRFERFKASMERYFHNDIRHVVNMFFNRSIMMVESGGFDIVGHLDKIGHNASHFQPGIEDEPWYRSLADDLVDCIVAKGVAVELNTKAYADHNRRLFPSRRLLKRLIDAGVTVLVNSDAHYPALIDASRDEAMAIIHDMRGDVAPASGSDKGSTGPRHVLITGGHGFIGDYIIRHHVSGKCDVTTLGLNTLNDISVDLSREVPDLGDKRFTTVIHTAGTTDASQCDAVNHTGTINLCKALERNPPKNLIYISSCDVYGVAEGIDISESHEASPVTLYGKSKLAAEEFLAGWSRSHGVTLTVLRPTSVIGNGLTGNMLRLAEKIDNGSYMHLPGCDATRNYIHAADLAAITMEIAGIPGIYNVNDTTPHTMHDISEAMATRLNNKRILTVPMPLMKLMRLTSRICPTLKRLLTRRGSTLTYSTAALRQALPEHRFINVADYLNSSDTL